MMMCGRVLKLSGAVAGVIFAAVLMLGMVVVDSAIAAPKCRVLAGQFFFEPVECPQGLCLTGSYTGTLRATSFLTVTGGPAPVFGPEVGAPVLLVTGENVIFTDRGEIHTADAILQRGAPPFDFTEIDTIVGGTGVWAGATGQITASGTFDFATGAGVYRGEVCVP